MIVCKCRVGVVAQPSKGVSPLIVTSHKLFVAHQYYTAPTWRRRQMSHPLELTPKYELRKELEGVHSL